MSKSVLPLLSAFARGSARGAIPRGTHAFLARASTIRSFASGPSPFGDARRSPAVGVLGVADLPSEGDLLQTIRWLEQPRQALTLPLFVMDSILPGQRLALDDAFDEVLACFAGLGEIGVFGMSCKPYREGDRDSYCHLHSHGVSAILQRNSANQWEIIAKRPIRLVGPAESGPDGMEFVRAEIVADEVCADDVEAAKVLAPLVAEWCEEVRRKNIEPFEGQLSGALEDLGAMPDPESAGDLAYWVAALVNLVPSLDVACEIRPAVLAAKSVRDRICIARKGIEGSIGHVTGRRLLF